MKNLLDKIDKKFLNNYWKYFLFTVFKKKQNSDDFHWDYYHYHYRGEIADLEKEYTVKLKKDDYEYSFEKGLLLKNNQIKPLHQNWKILYETILDLNVDSAFEMGCGNGMHLHNLNILRLTLRLSAIDRSKGQIQFSKELFPGLNADIQLADATVPLPSTIRKVDVAYTQAVIMHLQTAENYKEAIKNLFAISEKYIVLMENWTAHDFLNDIRGLLNSKKLFWGNAYFYYKEIQELNKPYIMIISKEPINHFRFHKLEDYEVLRKGVV